VVVAASVVVYITAPVWLPVVTGSSAVAPTTVSSGQVYTGMAAANNTTYFAQGMRWAAGLLAPLLLGSGELAFAAEEEQ